MAVNDETIIIFAALMFIYLVLYRNNKLFGNMAFASCGIALMSLNTSNTNSAVGIIILIGSIINLIYDLLKE